MQDDIAAIATASGTGGVAIVRISGSGAIEIAKKMFRASGGQTEFSPYRMYPGDIFADGFTDYGFLVCFKAPRSFTGENVAEFHCHGGIEIARGVLKKILSLGARSAEKGEFTKRAFLNGKLSLASAEGMADMINAESLALLRAGSMLYHEKLTNEVKSLQAKLTDLLARIAVEIDYPEEDEDGLDFDGIKRTISDLRGETSKLLKGYQSGKRIKNGVTVAICGAPNTGKSSLLNALLGYDKAIVSPIEGTTRDAVEGEIVIDGVIYRLVDTAGIRERAGEIEKIGIERAKNAISSADIVMAVCDGGEPVLPENCSGKVIRVFNKCDIKEPKGEYDIALSAKTGEGLDELKKILSEFSVGELSSDKAFVIEERHYDALKRADGSMASAEENTGEAPLEIISVDLKDAWDALGEITGETASEDIVNTVFEKFCVGK